MAVRLATPDRSAVASARSRTDRLTLAIVANELFARDVGRMGGFGWAVRQVSECFQHDRQTGVDVVLMMGERPPDGAATPDTLHGSPVLWPDGSLVTQLGRSRRVKPDLMLSIDFRSSYRRYFYALPRVPIIVWVRDPWTPEDREKTATLRIPGVTVEPQGVRGPDPRSLVHVAAQSRLLGRPLMFATTTPALAPKVGPTYGVEPEEVPVLPNIITPAPPGPIAKAEKPLVVFLARLDPVKRPWLFAALAEQLPEVEFIAMGQSHFSGPGSWQPENPPPNLRFVGHADEAEKQRILDAAWILVNTSIHEGLSVSFLEALAREVPIVSSVDPEAVVSRFGINVGVAPGTGMELLPAYTHAVRSLLEDPGQRRALGTAGRSWVEAAHSRKGFLDAFATLARRVGVALPPALAARVRADVTS